MWRLFGRGLRNGLVAIGALVFASAVLALADYTSTQGSGTTFGSIVVSGVHYVRMMVCDLTTPSQCATVSAGGAIKVDNSAVTQPVSISVGQIADGGDTTLGAKADAATCATANTLIACLRQLDADIKAAIPAGTNTIGTVGQLPYPVGATVYTATATGTTGATTATLAGASSVTTYICGFSIRANATAAATGNATVTGVITATLNFTQWTAPNASGLGITEMIFAPCVPASGTNQSVAVVSAAPGTGGIVSVTAWGYKL